MMTVDVIIDYFEKKFRRHLTNDEVEILTISFQLGRQEQFNELATMLQTVPASSELN